MKEKGLTLSGTIPLADHQAYDTELLEKLILASRNCDFLITTEKDAVKLTGLEFPVPCYQVGVELVFEDRSIFDTMLRALIAQEDTQNRVLS